jgi:hypothetical protein
MLSTPEEIGAALEELEERMRPLYRARAMLREEFAELTEPAMMPRPRERTSTQEKVARCPRCGGRVENE